MAVTYLWHNNLFQFIHTLFKTDKNQQMGIQRRQPCSNPGQHLEMPGKGKIS